MNPLTEQMDRKFLAYGWVMTSAGFSAVLRPAPDGDPEARSPPSLQMADVMAAWIASTPAPASPAALLAAIARPPCDTCKGARELPCDRGCVAGQLTSRTECEDCHKTHECTYPCRCASDGGPSCPCGDAKAVLVCGKALNAVLLADLIDYAGFDVTAQIGLCASGDDAGGAVLLRQGDLIAVCTPRRFAAEDLVGATRVEAT